MENILDFRQKAVQFFRLFFSSSGEEDVQLKEDDGDLINAADKSQKSVFTKP